MRNFNNYEVQVTVTVAPPNVQDETNIQFNGEQSQVLVTNEQIPKESKCTSVLLNCNFNGSIGAFINPDPTNFDLVWIFTDDQGVETEALIKTEGTSGYNTNAGIGDIILPTGLAPNQIGANDYFVNNENKAKRLVFRWATPVTMVNPNASNAFFKVTLSMLDLTA